MVEVINDQFIEQCSFFVKYIFSTDIPVRV